MKSLTFSGKSELKECLMLNAFNRVSVDPVLNNIPRTLFDLFVDLAKILSYNADGQQL